MLWACAAERWENNQSCCVTPSPPSCVTTVVQRPFRAKMVRFKQLNLSTGLKAWGERSRREPWQSECGVLRATCRSDSTRRAVCDGRRRMDVMLCDRKSYGNVCNHRLRINRLNMCHHLRLRKLLLKILPVHLHLRLKYQGVIGFCCCFLLFL